jgi:cobalt-zinc-cadmium efflux system outer membrane protein
MSQVAYRPSLGQLCLAALLTGCFAHAAGAQTYTWQELRQKFERTNPTLLAGEDSIAESKAQEITAFLRPNPDFSLSVDGTQLASYNGVYRPFAGTQYAPGISYLHERQNKRELRLESAKKGTSIAESQQEDLKRNLLFNLRAAFVNALQAKAVLGVAEENLKYYDHVLEVSQDRLKAGDIAKIDMMRLDLQRVQYESDIQTALVNVRTAKIQLLELLNDRTPIDNFDVTGPFDFNDVTLSLDEIHHAALDARPDLRAAIQSVDKAKTDHQLAVSNGSTDPTWSLWITHNPSFNNPFDNNTIGASVDIPLRLFDRNQGEKERTEIDIRRNQRLQDAATAQVYSDVDSAWSTVQSNVALLRPYKARYLEEAASVREIMTFSYQRGGASLLDFLGAESDYRAVRLNYINLVGAYLTAASQLNLAVGREVITQ